MLSVGDVLPQPFFKLPPVPDGATFNLSDDGTPFICLYLSQMSQEEQELIGGIQIESAYLSSDKGFWLGLLKFGEMIQELLFDPMSHFMAYGEFSPELFSENRLVTIIGVESEEMKIKTLRTATYPWRFLASLYQTFSDFTPNAQYSAHYTNFINQIDCFPLDWLWSRVTPSGCFGESRLAAWESIAGGK